MCIRDRNNSVRLLDNYHAVKFCSNSVANMVLNYYYSLALQQDIAFTARIDLPKELAIQDEDLSVLLGNLLENAIEMCIRDRPGWFRLSPCA